jgi:hypothetical protein
LVLEDNVVKIPFLGNMGLQYIVGSIILGLALALFFGPLSYLLLKLFRKSHV